MWYLFKHNRVRQTPAVNFSFIVQDNAGSGISCFNFYELLKVFLLKYWRYNRKTIL